MTRVAVGRTSSVSWSCASSGPATKTTEKRSLAHDPHDGALRIAAKCALKYPPVRFDALRRETIALGFANAIREGAYIVHACCVGRDHAHLIVARHSRTIKQIAAHLKSKATMALNRAELHPIRSFPNPDGSLPSPWANQRWNVFIDDPTHRAKAIAYVERHPQKEDLPPQHWDFITPAMA